MNYAPNDVGVRRDAPGRCPAMPAVLLLGVAGVAASALGPRHPTVVSLYSAAAAALAQAAFAQRYFGWRNRAFRAAQTEDFEARCAEVDAQQREFLAAAARHLPPRWADDAPAPLRRVLRGASP